MEHMKKQLEEIERLEQEQTLHRQQLEENRKRALFKKEQTKKLVQLGSILEELLPGIGNQEEPEIRAFLGTKFFSDHTVAPTRKTGGSTDGYKPCLLYTSRCV